MILLWLAAVAAAAPAPAPARTPARTAPDRPVVVSALTTEDLIAQCRGKDADPAPSFCTGYILGAFDTLSMAREICPSATKGSTIDAVATTRKYLRTKGKKAKAAPIFVVRDALRRSFACKRNAKR
ncbi:Rap1a/Tai family immunity protein [Sphingomonas aerolata]|uniref:Rap1a/Tai family immunity protein n=1 Tax=Sphingomonas aerolata TaxID=185951 RepID=UPI00335A2561